MRESGYREDGKGIGRRDWIRNGGKRRREKKVGKARVKGN